jgi:hypothetical protein
MRTRILIALFVSLTAAVPAAAGDSWVSIGVLAGATRPDTDLANYRWDVGGHGAYGVQALVGRGRWGTGLRWSRWSTSQSTGLLGVEAAPTVRLTSWQLLGQVHAVSLVGVRVLGSASVGRVHMGYDPDQLILQVEGVSEPVVVDFTPIDEWIVGLGLAVERSLYSSLSLGAELERTYFSLETAHRSGGVIEENRELFGNWNLRLRLSWALRIT